MMPTPLPERDALSRYRDCLFISIDIIELRTINPAIGEIKSHWTTAATLPAMAPLLRRKNNARCNIYVGPNPRCNFGERGDSAVELAPSMFADFDGIGVDQALTRIESIGLPRPTLVVTTGHGVHCYWRFNLAMENLDDWTHLQKDLIAAVDSDPVIHNPERIMRLPGFQNWKRDDGAVARIHEANPSRFYTYHQLRDIVLERPKPKPSPRSASCQTPIGDETDGEYWLRKALARVMPGVESQGRNATGYWLAQQLRDSRMSIVEAERWLRDYAAQVPGGDHPYYEHEAIKSLHSAFSAPRRERARRRASA
jgi:hypothetical protein